MTIHTKSLLTILLALSSAVPAMTVLADSRPAVTTSKSARLQEAVNRYNKTNDENEREIIRGQIKAMYYTSDSDEEKDAITDFFRTNHAQVETQAEASSRRPASLN